MAVRPPPVHLLGEPTLRIGDDLVKAPSGGIVDHIYAATGAVTGPAALAGPEEIELAATCARAIAARWRDTPGDQRRNALLRLADLVVAHGDELVSLQMLEIGMPIQFARQLPALAADWLRYHAGWADKRGGDVIDSWPLRSLDYTLDEPYGVVAGIIPWNGALMSTIQLWGPALATGNVVVTKPSELAPFVAVRLAELAAEAGVPTGVITVVPGGASAGQALAGHPEIDKVFFTGGSTTARHVLGAAAAHLTPVALELGGKSPHLVFADADLRITARQAMSGIVALSGQGCANGTRLLVHESIAERLLEILLARLRHTPTGDPADERTMVGPVVSQAACERIMGMIDRGREQGRLLTGGSRAGGELANGFFVEPTVFADLHGDCELIREEIFGPVLTVHTFTDDAEAIAMANSGYHDLAAYIHTNDLRRAHRVSRELAAGAIWINGIPGLRPSTPFGGGKRSGSGRVGGAAGIREFLRPKNVWLSL